MASTDEPTDQLHLTNETVEDLIERMTADEVCELLSEMGVEIDDQQAIVLQRMIESLGSIDEALRQLDDTP